LNEAIGGEPTDDEEDSFYSDDDGKWGPTNMERLEGDEIIKPEKLKDTIPDALLSRTFMGKNMPSLHNYSAIGFMADHCIVKYNMEEWVRLVV
jgi:hypothetical protein